MVEKLIDFTNKILINLRSFRFSAEALGNDAVGIVIRWGFCIDVIKITFPDNHVRIEIISPNTYDGIIDNEEDYYNYYNEIEEVRKIVVELYCNRDRYMNIVNG